MTFYQYLQASFRSWHDNAADVFMADVCFQKV